jgi:hypothetical protein
VFTDQVGVLNGTNSGLCGFNLAYQMRPKQILLFGFDMKRGPNGEAHWFPDYPWAKPGGATTSGQIPRMVAAVRARQSDPATPPASR